MEADILQLAARAYQELMTVEYQVVLGRKGKAHTIEIAFRADNFYHLAGLHKLKQRYPFQQQTEYSATGVPPIRKSGTAFPRKVYRLSAKVYRLFFRL